MSLQLTQGLLFKMHIRTSHIVKTLIIFSFLITNTAEADKLIFDVSNSKVTIGDKKIMILQFMVSQIQNEH